MRRLAVIALVLAAGCGGGSSPTAPKRAETSPKRTAAACTATQTEGETSQVSAASDETPWRVRMGPGGAVARTPATIAAGGRGKPLLLSGVVRGEDCAPLAGATVNAWQTNAAGKYGPGRTCCYLQGTARTDRRGRYAFRTVVPGEYNGRPHIHIEAGHASAGSVLTEIVIDGRPSRVRWNMVLPSR